MHKHRFYALYSLYTLLLTLCANSYILLARQPLTLAGLIPIFLFTCLLSGLLALPAKSLRLKYCFHGGLLLTCFVSSVILSLVYHVVLAFLTIPDNYKPFIWSAVLCIVLEAIAFWCGILCVYATSVQLGIKQRVVGAVCGMIPIANLFALRTIIRTVLQEVRFETEKEKRNKDRQAQQVCATRYPLLLVHGVFFRDTAFFNYWGRIPKELEQNGAVIHYGNHASAASVQKSAQELTARIEAIVKETGCEKVNIIAHSKGGLDCRYAMAACGAAPYVASLTTINTPHRGCLFADYLLTKIPNSIKDKVANTYNGTLKKFGETEPDFLSAVNDLTAAACTAFDNTTPPPEGVFCQSVGSIMPTAAGGKFPLNFSYHLAKYFDGANDGLVSERSFRWGDTYTLLTTDEKRGISHADMIDLNRENITGFDVREFYVNLVSNLKKRGL